MNRILITGGTSFIGYSILNSKNSSTINCYRHLNESKKLIDQVQYMGRIF